MKRKLIFVTITVYGKNVNDIRGSFLRKYEGRTKITSIFVQSDEKFFVAPKICEFFATLRPAPLTFFEKEV